MDDYDEDEWEPLGNPGRDRMIRIVALVVIVAMVLPVVVAFFLNVFSG